jgi:hypothetical protein
VTRGSTRPKVARGGTEMIASYRTLAWVAGPVSANSLASRGEDVSNLTITPPRRAAFCMSCSRLIIGASLGLMCGSEQKALRRKTYCSRTPITVCRENSNE